MTSSLRVLTAALSRSPMRRALGAYLVFSVAEWATWVALLVWAYAERGVGGAATVSVVQLVPAVIVAPLGAVAGDRAKRGAALATGYALQGATVLATAAALAFDLHFTVVCLGGVLVTCAITLTRPVHNALMPELSHTPAELTAGNAATAAAESVGMFLGPATCGLLMVGGGAGSVFVLFGVLLLLSALLVLRLPASAEPRPVQDEGYLRNVSAGVGELGRQPTAAILLGTIASQYVVLGLLDILVVVLALDVLGTGQSGPGLLGGALGIGCLIGAVGSVVLVGIPRLLPAMAIGLLAMGLPLAALGISGSAWVAAALLAVSGAGKSFFDVAGRTLLQRAVSERVLARVFGLQESLLSGATALGALLAPLLLLQLGTTGAFVATGLLLPVCAAVAWHALRRLDARALPPGPFLEALRGIAFLRLAPLAAVESMSRRAEELMVPAGTDVVQEGQLGDRFYVVLSGHLDVSRQGKPVRRLGPGAFFGEVAILRDTARTATVTAAESARLVTVGRQDFLGALAAAGGGRAAADGVVKAYLDGDARHPAE